MKLFTLLIASTTLSTLFGTNITRAAEPKIGDARVKASVDKGLAYLALQQSANGAWRIEKVGDSTAATSLVVLSFLAHGHVPGKGPHGERIQKGIDWVLSHQAKVAKKLGKKTGALLPPRKNDGFMYAHGMGTLMLAESLKHLNRRDTVRCRGALTRAVKLILLAQKVKKRVPGHEGGWRYLPSSESSDLSISTWQLKALYAAKAAGTKVSNASFTQALAFMGRCKSKDDDGFAYVPRSREPSSTKHTAMALSCFVLFEKKNQKHRLPQRNF